jgi:hypothetical protein
MARLRENKWLSWTANHGLRTVGHGFRSLLMLALLVLAARVSAPQSRTVWSAYEVPSDFLRLSLGVLSCLWIGTRMVSYRSDAEEGRMWFYLGLALLPLSIIVIVWVW